MSDRVRLHAVALVDADRVVRSLTDDALSAPSQCAAWSVRDCVEHMTGQNMGFAAAISAGEAPPDAYRPRSMNDWSTSVEQLGAATLTPASEIVLVEVAPQTAFALDRVAAIHALDLAVHAWDIDQSYRPSDELTELVLAVAQATAARQTGQGPFAPSVPTDSTDPWYQALSLLGRDPQHTLA